jgi:hypothetical protein
MTHPVTIRYAADADLPALARLATLDSADPLSAPILVAVVDGELSAALSLADARVIADPFQPTSALVELLQTRARQLTSRRRTGVLQAPRSQGRGLGAPWSWWTGSSPAHALGSSSDSRSSS